MTASSSNTPARALPRHVAVLGGAGGLGRGILGVCRTEGIGFTAIVRSRPERIIDVPEGSRVVVIPSLADRDAMTEAFAHVDAVLAALGVTSTSQDRSALLSVNIAEVAAAMLSAGVDRLILINTMIAAPPGKPASPMMRLFSLFPGVIGRGCAEQQAVVDAVGSGALSSLRWTLVRAGVNSRGIDERPVASPESDRACNSWLPVSYQAMGRWMLEEAAANSFVCASPVVSRGRR